MTSDELEEGTGEVETQTQGPADDGAVSPGWARAAGAAALFAGVLLVGRLDREGVTGGILLLVAALGLLATGWGQGRYGPESEGPLDLSTRIAVGLLGGSLGGIAYLATALVGDVVGLPDLFGSGWVVAADAARWGAEAARGAVWGLVLALSLRWLPGRDPVRQATLFALVPTLWVGLVTFPGLEFGAFGARLGALTMIPVLLYHLAWGMVVGGTLRWARETEHGPLSRPLGA